jgi:mRNA interferase MazF
MRRGEIYIGQFPFGDAAKTKWRPVLLLTGTVGLIPEVLVAYISSKIPHTLLESDLLMDPATTQFQSTRLKRPSVLRLHKLATLHSSSLVSYLGSLDPVHRPVISLKLRALLEL